MAGKELKALIKELEAQHFTVVRSKNNHHIVYKGKARVATLPGTPSDSHSWKNVIAVLRRAGFIWRR